jgi:hypothetical protein
MLMISLLTCVTASYITKQCHWIHFWGQQDFSATPQWYTSVSCLCS